VVLLVLSERLGQEGWSRPDRSEECDDAAKQADAADDAGACDEGSQPIHGVVGTMKKEPEEGWPTQAG
jgi:hypothetical protein